MRKEYNQSEGVKCEKSSWITLHDSLRLTVSNWKDWKPTTTTTLFCKNDFVQDERNRTTESDCWFGKIQRQYSLKKTKNTTSYLNICHSSLSYPLFSPVVPILPSVSFHSTFFVGFIPIICLRPTFIILPLLLLLLLLL